MSNIASNFTKNKDIFLAHRFGETSLVTVLKKIIKEKGYSWKEGKRTDLGSISRDILNKIQESGFFLALMTKKDELKKKSKYTVSSWLIEEKGAAIAFGHRPLIMVERGVDRHYVGFLQGDDQMIYFERPDFEERAIEAIETIDRTYIKKS